MNSLKLLRIDNVYYIELDGERIAIEEWEAAEIVADHGKVYDAVIRHKRKFDFNTAEDNGEFFAER